MSRDVIINTILTIIGVILLILVLLQSGLFGENLKVTSWFGIGASSVAAQDNYQTCKQNGGELIVAIPRSCQKDGKTYYDSYSKADETSYRQTAEKEAAELGSIIATPLNSQSLNRAVLDQPVTDIVTYGAIYSSKQDNQMVYAKIYNKSLKGVANNSIWEQLINAQKPEDLQTVLGGNTASVSSIDLTSRGFTKAVLIVDGEKDRVLAPYSVLVAAQVRDNYVLLTADLTIENFSQLIADCVKSQAVLSAQDKDIESQKCLNTKINTDTALQSSILTKAQKLAEVFAF